MDLRASKGLLASPTLNCDREPGPAGCHGDFAVRACDLSNSSRTPNGHFVNHADWHSSNCGPFADRSFLLPLPGSPGHWLIYKSRLPHAIENSHQYAYPFALDCVALSVCTVGLRFERRRHPEVVFWAFAYRGVWFWRSFGILWQVAHCLESNLIQERSIGDQHNDFLLRSPVTCKNLEHFEAIFLCLPKYGLIPASRVLQHMEFRIF